MVFNKYKRAEGYELKEQPEKVGEENFLPLTVDTGEGREGGRGRLEPPAGEE